MQQDNKRKKIKNSAVLIGVVQAGQTKDQAKEYIDELALLAHTAGTTPVKSFLQKQNKPNPRSYIGKGKLTEIRTFIQKNKTVNLVLFDDDLSPTQLRNIEKELHIQIMDRTNLILDIFATRARTANARTQVELAQYQYLLPRLKGMWTHLERQRGGIGLRGPGEREIETDRRIVRDKIALLRKQLAKIDKQKATQRKNRGKLIRVSLVGYTNAGKSTIMNRLSKSEVFAEDKLFATLDTTVRKVVINNLPFLLSDTVGFIRKLPTHLVESFKSTLDETRESDLLIHIVDVSHPGFEEQIEVVKNTLQEIGAANIPVLLVFNKIDAFKYTPKDEDDLTPREKQNFSLDDFKAMYVAGENIPCVFISAKTGENMDEFKDNLFKIVKDLHFKRFPYNRI
ncbi:MAG: GTPase HflX [Bacteroidota bacterium]|nr:GTPase HflX [Bacteroidota bacterium]